MTEPYFQPLTGAAFLAFPDAAPFLLSELKERLHFYSEPAGVYGDLFYFSDFPAERLDAEAPYWAKCVMKAPVLLRFQSIGECARALRSVQRNWAPYQFTCFRRAQFIQEKLPYINLKPRSFPVSIPKTPMGLWTLLDDETALCSAQTNSFLPAGELRFIEDRENPPSRAYLKLQESLTLMHLLTGTPLPSASSRCFEAGASPGGWTWVLTQLGASVHAVDRAPLSPELMANPLVRFTAHDAFTLLPEEIGDCDWILSDVICYPERLYDWITRLIASGCTANMICTIKMQGKTDWTIIKKFSTLPNSRVVHLNYNKHELTLLMGKRG
ncbi:MAG: SAM-dependent methyltransferase [Treponema sp.]